MRRLHAAALSVLALGAQDIIPAPVRFEARPGHFTLDAATRIVTPPEAVAVGERLACYLRPATGLPLAVGGRAGKDTIVLVLDAATGLGEEGYRLEAGPDRVTIKASRPAGLFYGVQSLRQLLPAASFREAKVDGVAWTLPAVAIEDSPRYAWRGSHMDVGRHFMPKAFLKKHLDLMALHKLNVFHWHLTEDQGWRLELARHPRLAQVGGWRRETVLPEFARVDVPDQMQFDHTPHGGV